MKELLLTYRFYRQYTSQARYERPPKTFSSNHDLCVACFTYPVPDMVERFNIVGHTDECVRLYDGTF